MGNIFTRSATAFQVVALINLFCAAGPVQRAQTLVPETVYSNTTPITINTTASAPAPAPASVYPSNIQVTGMTGVITRVAVTLDGFTHSRANDVDLLLVSPTGAKFILLADAGGFVSFDDKLFVISDDAAATIPAGGDVPSGNYRPTSGDRRRLISRPGACRAI